MPLRREEQPDAADLRACLARARKNQQRWKNFRDGKCGQGWFEALRAAYPPSRCAYCDHAPGRTIDHVSAHRRLYAWANWILACGDCNRGKSTYTLINPYDEDPRDSLGFDPNTGESRVRKGLGRARRERAERTRSRLGMDHQVLLDARRHRARSMLLAMVDLIDGIRDVDEVRRELDASHGSRAVLRDLILDEDDATNPYWVIVRRARQLMPELVGWAKDPLTEV